MPAGRAVRKSKNAVQPGGKTMIELKRGGGDQFFVWTMVVMTAFVPLLFGFAGFALLASGEGMGALLIVFALPFLWLTYYVYREAAARSFTRVAISDQSVELRLPAQRSYAPQEKVEATIPLGSIRAIEARAEAFRAAGNSVLQYAYSLALNDGRRIVLGADRRFTQPFYQEAANAISSKTQIPIRDLGLVDGNPGFLLVAGQSAPPWDAPAVPQATMQQRFKQEESGWRVAWIITSAALAIGMIARAFN